MKTILHTIETGGPGGAENVLIRLAKYMSEQGYRNIALLLKDGWLAEQLRANGVIVFIHQGKQSTFNIINSIRKLIAQESVDIIHSHEFMMNACLGLCAPFIKPVVVCTVHGKNYYGDKLRRKLLYRLVAMTTHFVVVSKDIASYLTNIISINPTKIHLIQNGIDIYQYQHNPEVRSAARKELGLNNTDSMILSVGNLYSVKGHEFLIKAMALLQPFPQLKLYIAGRGELEANLQKLIHVHDLKQQVTLLGFRDDVPALLQACDIFCLPSLSEGLPLSILEAMSAKKVIIASDVGGIGEIVIDNKTGKLTPPKGVTELATAISEVLKNTEKTAQLQHDAYQLIEKNFNIKQMAQQYTNLYNTP